MASHTFCYISALLYVCATAFALPPLYVPSILTSGVSSLTLPLNTSTLHVTSGFPPYPPPPVFFYEIPGTQFVIKFKRYLLEKNRDETQVAEVLRAATAEVFTHDTEAPMPTTDHVWRSGAVDMELVPEKRSSEKAPVLTWRYWMIALSGLRGFTKAYPGLGFQFEIYKNEVVETKLEEFFLGSGLLFAII